MRRIKRFVENSDYRKLQAALEKIGAESVGDIGYLEPATYEGFASDLGSFIVGKNDNGQICLYHFVGKDGDPVEKDIQYVLSLKTKGDNKNG